MLCVVQCRLNCLLIIGTIFVILAMIIEGYSQYTTSEIVLIHLYNLVAFFSVFMYYLTFFLQWRTSLSVMNDSSKNSSSVFSHSIFGISAINQVIDQPLDREPYDLEEIALDEPERLVRSERRPVQNQLGSNSVELNLHNLHMVPEPRNDHQDQHLFLDSEQLTSRYSWKTEKRIYKFTTFK